MAYLRIFFLSIVCALFLSVGCSTGSQAPLTISEASLIGNPNPAVPLAAIMRVTTNRPTRLTLNISDAEQNWSVTPSQEMTLNHEVPVLGLKPEKTYNVAAVLEDMGGRITETPALAFETPPLPDTFPTPVINIHDPSRMEPGVTLFNINGRWEADGNATLENLPAVVVDDQGEFIWYYIPDGHRVHDIRRLKNGNMAYTVLPGHNQLIEIDMLGNIQRTFHMTGMTNELIEGSISVQTDSLHHDYAELPNGNLLLLSSESRVIQNWYASETNPDATRAPANVIGDVIVEITQNGEIVNEWSLFDILDPYRIGYNSTSENFWRNHYGDTAESKDWAHGNAIIYEENDHSFVMSVPYQDAVIKVSMDTGELVWILGNHDNWKEPWSDKLLTPVGAVEWSYKHHAITHTENGTYLLFDNGVARSSPYDDKMVLADSYSRAVEYSVNEQTMEVSQPWVYGPNQEQFYGRYLGDVDWHEQSDTILINVGGAETNSEGINVPPTEARRWAQIMEVTHTNQPEKVWELRLQQNDTGWSIYRAERIESLYP
jgi:arylsulfate sulfotransferase